MVFIYGFCGFLIGFAIGLGIVNVMLMKKTKQQLKEDRSLAKVYGGAVWFLAFVGAYVGYWLFKNNII